jgi:hypothetical protein
VIDLVRLKAVYMRILQAHYGRDVLLRNALLEAAAADLEVVLGQAGVPPDEIAQMALEGMRA